MSVSPFADTPDVNPAECTVYARPARAKKYVDPLGDSSKKQKKIDLAPMQRRWFEARDWTYQKTEVRDYVFKTHDLWTFGDWLVIDDQPGSLIVQTTSKPNVTERLKKAEGTPELRTWLERGNRFEVHGWEKDGVRWQVKRTAVQLIDGQLARVAIEDAGRRRAGR